MLSVHLIDANVGTAAGDESGDAEGHRWRPIIVSASLSDDADFSFAPFPGCQQRYHHGNNGVILDTANAGGSWTIKKTEIANPW